MKKIAVLLMSFVSVYSFSQKKWSLQECVNYAMENNLQVLQNQLNTKTQNNSLDIAKRQYLPSVSGNLNNTASFGQGRDVFGTTNRNDNFSNSANVGADILVFNNGRLEKNIRKTEFEVEASKFDLQRIKNDI